jgi:hypothetical protein
MLKRSYTADVVDDPYRFDLPKPLDLLVMDELEREQQWKYEQARRRFKSEEEGLEGISMHSLSQASFGSEDDLREKPLPDESAGFIPKLTDIQQKLQDEVDSKPVPKSVAIDEDAKILPKFTDVKDKYLATDESNVADLSNKEPFKYPDDEHFDGVRDIKKKLPVEKTPAPQEYVMPTTAMKGDKDLKKMMEERKKLTDENVDDRAESAAQEIRSLASDISKTLGSDDPKESQDKPTKAEPAKKVSSEKKPEKVKEKQEQPKRKGSGSEEATHRKPQVKSLDEMDSAKKKPDEKKLKPPQPPAKDKQEDKSKSFTLGDNPALDQKSTSK